MSNALGVVERYKIRSYLYKYKILKLSMSKKELSQSEKDLAEELAYGIYLGDSPIWMIIALFFLSLMSLITLGWTALFFVIFFLIPLWIYYTYRSGEKRCDRIDYLCQESLKNDLDYSQIKELKTSRKNSTIENIEHMLKSEKVNFSENDNVKEISFSGAIFYFLTISLLILTFSISSENSNTPNVEIPENNINQNNNNNANEELEAEVVPMGDGLTSFTIINRNDFDWENIEVTVNDYYTCSDFQNSIMSGEQVTFIAERCDEFVSNGNIVVNKLEIETNEGDALFERR